MRLLNIILFRKLPIALPLRFAPLPRRVSNTRATIPLKREP